MLISVNEFRERLAEMLTAVEAGEDVIVTRHGKPVARLVRPIEAQPRPMPSRSAFRQRLREQGVEPDRSPLRDQRDDERY